MPKTAVLPQVRVAPELRDDLQAALADGETLSDFVEAAVRRALDYRTMQTAFAARGNTASDHFAMTGEKYTTEQVTDELRAMTQRRRADLLSKSGR
jgi:Arc/MetJ-type ribon-helix-helix transcriptional regulator